MQVLLFCIQLAHMAASVGSSSRVSCFDLNALHCHNDGGSDVKGKGKGKGMGQSG